MSNATLSLLLFLPATFGRKKCLSIITVNPTLRVHCDVYFGGVLDYGRNYGTMFYWAAGKY